MAKPKTEPDRDVSAGSDSAPPSGDSDVSAPEPLPPDVFFVSAELDRSIADRFRAVHEEQANHDQHCILVLTTPGGDADAAYIMSRYLRRVYEHLTVCVFGYCKSAGTLLALGAHELVMGRRGELGPLDVQVSEKDQLVRDGSGLEIFTSLGVLFAHAYESFERYFLTTVERSRGQITTKTAADIATTLAIGLMAPISAQVDPLRLGREQRELDIASHYAQRLDVSAEAIAQLTKAYPSHGFVIDREEAIDLLAIARSPNEMEEALESALSEHPGLYYPEQDSVICLTPQASDDVASDPTESDPTE